jgi:hypothetical protein
LIVFLNKKPYNFAMIAIPHNLEQQLLAFAQQKGMDVDALAQTALYDYLLRKGQSVSLKGGNAESPAKRQLGCWEGRVTLSDDFDAPLPQEVLNAFGVE